MSTHRRPKPTLGHRFAGMALSGFRSAARILMEPRKPRHRVARVVVGLVGLCVLAMLLVMAVVVGAVMIAGGLVWRMLRGSPRPARERRVFEAEYRVVSKPLLTR